MKFSGTKLMKFSFESAMLRATTRRALRIGVKVNDATGWSSSTRARGDPPMRGSVTGASELSVYGIKDQPRPMCRVVPATMVLC